MKRKPIDRDIAERYTRLHGGRIFLHRAGRLGYQYHLQKTDGELVRITKRTQGRRLIDILTEDPDQNKKGITLP